MNNCRRAKQLKAGERETHGCHDKTDDSESDYKARVETELSRYLDVGLEVPTSRFNLLAFWKASRETYPNIYAIALDCLPMQPVAVSCERIFSRSEHTDALRDGRMSFRTFETLQRLKFSGGKVRLHDTVWSNLDIEEAFTSYRPAHKYTLDTLLNALPY
ncbi:hypothetical protein QCA50_011215 [Cerrena zonata]|uniref:HAT C-terminal dimerisation domain-containing protein n=1 Tax=Cerrena zonata TaxID=2478898 RepID=A0AAW0FWJ3_9APHY